MKKIIVPIDFSNHSEYALKAAALLAKKHNGAIYALHMLDIQDVTLTERASYHQEKTLFFLKLAEKRFISFLKKDYLKDIKVVPVIKHYKVFSEVNLIAEETNADLIVMGSHGAGGLKEFFWGSNTEKVIRYSTIPVLVVKSELKSIAFNDVVFATGFSEKAIPAYKKAIKLLDILGFKTHLLYVNLPNEKFKTTTEMNTLASDFLMNAEGNIDRLSKINFVCEKSIEKGILKFSNVIGADLISVLTHGRKGLSHVFKGSISEDIANHSPISIITFKI